MEKPYFYEIRVEGHLAERWSDWFGGMAICNEPGGETVLSGLVADQAALIGLLNQVHSLHLILVSVLRQPNTAETKSSGDLPV